MLDETVLRPGLGGGPIFAHDAAAFNHPGERGHGPPGAPPARRRCIVVGGAMRTLVLLAGLGQLALAAASLAIPRVLGWRGETAKLRPLLRQLFWTYAAYVWGSHIAFGLLSTLAPDRLLDGSPLARGVAGFIAVWWIARVVLQFVYLDRAGLPAGARFRWAEAGLVLLFVFLAIVYSAVAVR